jgi:uncharacterized protein (TIGR00106 family)
MLIEFSTFPIGEETGLSEAVSAVIDIVDRSGLPYKSHSMGTLVEGDWEEVMDLIKTCHHHLRDRYDRIETRIVIDDRKGVNGQLNGKIASVEEKLGRQVKK